MSTLNVNNITKYTGGEVVVNDASEDVDFRVESNGNANMLFVDGGNNTVGINEASNTRAFFQVTADVAVAADACRLEGNSANGIPLVLDNLRADAASEHTIHFFRDGSRFAAIGGTDTSLQFFNASAVTMQIDSTGAVTKPLQPYVFAYANADQTLDADDADKTVALNAELKDVNSDFNTTNYTFTAPVDGAYLVNGFYRFTGDTATQATDWILKFTASNGTETVWTGNPSVWETGSGSAYSKSVNVSKTIYMDASDTLTMTTDVYSGGSYTYDIDGHANSYQATSMQVTLLC